MLFGSTSSLGAFCPQHLDLSTLSADPDVILECLLHPRLHLHQEPRSQTTFKTLKITIFFTFSLVLLIWRWILSSLDTIVHILHCYNSTRHNHLQICFIPSFWTFWSVFSCKKWININEPIIVAYFFIMTLVVKDKWDEALNPGNAGRMASFCWPYFINQLTISTEEYYTAAALHFGQVPSLFTHNLIQSRWNSCPQGSR